MRKLISGLATAAIALGIVGLPALATPASALSPGLSFSSVNQPTWQTNGVVWALGQSHGLVVAGGTFTSLVPPPGQSGNARPVSALAILDAETGNPAACQLSVGYTGGTPTVRAVATSPDGNTVYIAGAFSSVGGVSVSRFAAINPATCTVLPLRISSISSTVRAISATTSTIYIGGDFMSVSGQTRQRFAAVSASTGALLPFSANADNVGRAVATSPDGTKVAIGGDFDHVNGADSHSIAVVDAITGAVVRNYPLGFITQTSVTKTIVSSGNAFYVGNEGTGGGVFDGRFAIDWNTLDQLWRDTCLGATQAVLVYKNLLYSAVHAHDCSSMNEFPDGKRNYFIAEGIDNPTLVSWNPVGNDGINEGIGPRALIVSTGKTTNTDFLWAGGEFTMINGKTQMGLTRFGPTPSAPPPAATVTAEALTPGAIQVRVRTVVDPDDSVLTYSIYRNGAATPIWTGQATSLWWTRPQITFNDTDVVPGTNYSYRVTVTDGTTTTALSGTSTAKASATGSPYASTIIADNPDLYWRYDGNSTAVAQDKSGATLTGLNGLYKFGVTPGMPGPITGDTGSAAEFNGTDGYLYNDQSKPGPSTYSVETWFKTTSTTGGELISYGSGRPRTDNLATNPSGSYDRNVYMDNAGHVLSGTYVGFVSLVSSPKTYNDGQWHHVVSTLGSSGTNLYIDGVRVASNGQTGAQSYNGVWHVGGDNLNGWPSQPSSTFFSGQMAETAVYNHALTYQQITNHFVAGGGTTTTNKPPTDAYGAAVFNGDPQFYWRFNEPSGQAAADSSFAGQNAGTLGSGVVRNATGGVMNGPDISTTGNDTSTVATTTQLQSSPSSYSIQGWFKTTSNQGGKIFGFENAQTGLGSNYDKQVYMTNSGALIFGVYTGGFQTVQTPASYNDGQWHQVVATQGPGGMTLYVDGVNVGTNPTSDNQSYAGYWRTGGGNLGSWPSQPSSNFFTGSIDEMAVYYNTMTAAAVQQQYNLAVPDTTAPSVPAGVAANATGQNVTLTWTASTDNVGVTGYDVFRGTSAGFVAGAASKIGSSTTASYADTVVTPGTYFYKVEAFDVAGNNSDSSTAASVTVADTQTPSVPAGVVATATTGGVQLSWSASTDNVAVTGYDVYRGTSADFAVGDASKVGHVTSPAFTEGGLAAGTYYYKVVASDAAGNTSAPSSAAQVAVLDALTPSTPMNVAATVSGDSVSVTWTASIIGNGDTPSYNVYRGSSADFAVGAASLLGQSTQTNYADNGLGQGSYYYKIVAVAPGGQTSAPSDAVSGSIADLVAPSVPANLAATASGGTVGLSWSPATDNVGVTGYEVYRGTSLSFVVGDTSRIGTTVSTTYSNAVSTPGTYYYKVTAFDAAGNSSGASLAATATIVAPSVTVKVNPAADAMVAQAAPGTNYGSANYMSTRSSASTMLSSYLNFSLPAAPDGMVLTGAKLQVRTTTDSTSGTADDVTLKMVTTPWTESTVNWNNRPSATSAPALSTMTGATAINTVYSFTLDTTVVASLEGSNGSFLMDNANSGIDNFRIWSKESTTVSYRPVLLLEYSSK